ncbi:hypothetical protein K439DRAFT_894845 [Ramaria rubella]|nr:hypothetical protein K439DRAFT_894845 [Ramaria rubella]
MRGLSLDEERPLPLKDWKRQRPRLRSGSGTTTTSTSESADELSVQVPLSQSSLSSATSSQPSAPSSSTSVSHFIPPPRNQSHGVVNGQPETPRPLPPPSQSLSNTSLGVASNTHFALSPIASRVLANDADAMAEYMKRNRSGSHGESSRHVIVQASSPQNITTPPIMEEPIAQKYSLRRLRPSLSAAALRQPPPPVSVVSPGPGVSGAGSDVRSRFRAGTNPSSSFRPQFSPPASSSAGLPEESSERVAGPRRAATSGILSSLHEPRNASPARRSPITSPPTLPPKDDYQVHRRGPSVS